MADDLIGYPQLMESALKSVVRAALDLVAVGGLPGAHHMYITFRTGAPGVDITPQLKSQYTEEMTIVLQHQFLGLETNDDGFEVTLKFGGNSERLVVPWDAMVGFVDPSVEFGLRFGMDLESVDDEGAKDLSEAETRLEVGDPKITEDGEPGKTGEIVTLDSFRKK